MRKLIIILCLYLLSCSPEKALQVHGEYWVLVEKKEATRYIDSFTWLIWENQNGIRYWEGVSDIRASAYPIGTMIYNRTK